jgi:hypothetical protein
MSHDQHTDHCFPVYMISHHIDSTFHRTSAMKISKLAD